MWLEAILTRDDLVSIIGRLAPMTISLGEPTSADQSVHLTEVAGVSLVGGEGLRVTCRAWIEWPLLGITGRISIDPLTLMLKPSISTTAAGHTLVFTPEVERADVVRLPDAVDEVTERINRAMYETNVTLSWTFAQVLNEVISGPSLLPSSDSLNACASGGRAWVTEEALVIAVPFRSWRRSERDVTSSMFRASPASAAHA